MKLNKILMSTLVGYSLLTPVILSSCSIKNSNSSSNNEEQKPKTIPVPFQSSLYDTWDPTSNSLTFGTSADTTYEIPSVDEWLKNESNNGRNFSHKETIYGSTKDDSFGCDSRLDGNLHSPLFKTVNDFYTWIKKSENNYDLSLWAPNENIEDKIFNFRTINWDFITNPNCYTSIYIYIYILFLMK
ncbi:hypothetical protein [Malacoplasma muris]|uniref:hypothetical protein n=1 Tax=Malacoplasma muris TaxID=2119 RepID=UPI00398EE4B0